MKDNLITRLKRTLSEEEEIYTATIKKIEDLQTLEAGTRANIEFLLSKISKEEERIQITDHAVIRYIERIEKRDMEALRKSIVTDVLLQQVKTLGDGTYPVCTDYARYRAVVSGGCIVTILPPE